MMLGEVPPYGGGLPGREIARRKMMAFYARYLPDKVGQVDSILDQYPGNEEAVVQAMQTKYPTWNFDYTPPDISPAISTNLHIPQSAVPARAPQIQHGFYPGSIPGGGGQSVYSAGSPPPLVYHPQQAVASVPMSAYQQSALAVSPPPAGSHPSRDDLVDFMTQLENKIMSHQRQEMHSLEGKMQRLVDLAESQRSRQENETNALRQQQQQALQAVALIKEESERKYHSSEAEKENAIGTLRNQVESLTRMLQTREVESKKQADMLREREKEARLRTTMQELEDLRTRESHRLRDDVIGQTEVDKLRSENQLLREEGEEGRELIMELHGAIEELRHSNRSQTTEIQTLLDSTSVLKRHQDQLSRDLSEARSPKRNEDYMMWANAEMAKVMAQQQVQQMASQQRFTQPAGYQQPAAVGQPAAQQPHPSVGIPQPAVGISPPRPNRLPQHDLMASLQNRHQNNLRYSGY